MARQINADTLLIDERKALMVARKRGLEVTGTIGVLELAAQRNLIEFSYVIGELRKTTFRCSDDLLDQALRRDEKRRA